MKIRLEQRPPAKIMGALLQILPILTVLRLVFFLRRIVKIFERDNVLCIALKVSVFFEKILQTSNLEFEVSRRSICLHMDTLRMSMNHI